VGFFIKKKYFFRVFVKKKEGFKNSSNIFDLSINPH